MRRILKWVGTLVVVLVVLAVALAIAVPLLFDINDQKDRIAAIVERETGRALTIDGDLELSVFPWLAVRSGAMSLAQVEGFDTEFPFAAFESAEVSVKLMPLLLRREFEVGRISLHGLQMRLERDADGNDNWSDLIDRDDERHRPETEPTDDAPFDLQRLDVAGVTLRGARIAYRDQQAGTAYVVEDLDLTTGQLRLGEPVELTLTGRIASAVPQWRATVEFAGRADYRHDGQLLDAFAERLVATVEGGALPVDRAEVSGSAKIRGGFTDMNWRVEDMDITASGSLDRDGRSARGEARLAGDVDYRGTDGAVEVSLDRADVDASGEGLPLARLRGSFAGRISGNLEQETWRVDAPVVNAVLRGGELPDRDHPVEVRANHVQANLAAQTAAVRDLQFSALGLRGTATADGTRIVDEPSFTGRIVLEGFNPRELLALVEREFPETRDPTALTHVAFNAAFAASRRAVSLSELDGRVDASRLRGRVAITDLETRATRFDLDIDRLDLDRYLPPEADTETEAGALDAVEIPTDVIRGLDVEGAARIARLRAFEIDSEDVRVGVRAQGGQLRVHPATARLYGGSYTGDINVDARGGTPRVFINERLSGVQAGALFDELFEETRIVGTADMSARLSGSGATVGAVRRTLEGDVAFSFRDGAVKGFDLWHLIRDARAVMRGEERPPRPTGEPQTEFGMLGGTGTVSGGVLDTQDLSAQLPFMAAAGRGRMDLAEATVDFRMNVTVQRVPGVDGEQGEQELRGTTIPFIVSGPIDDMSYRVDLAGILRDRIQQEVDGARERLEQELQERLRRIFR